jgi:hypothetical protein
MLESRDADGDGKLSKEEMGPNFAERVFPTADKNSDGYLDREELALFYEESSRRGPRDDRGPGARGPGFGAPGQPLSYHDSMEEAGRAMRGLRRSEFDGTSREADLASIQRIQVALLSAKARIDEVEMSDAARARFGDDVAGYHRAFRLSLIKALAQTLKLESAVAENDAEAAGEALATLREIQRASHDLFQQEEEEDGAPAARPGRGGRPAPGTGGGG